MNVTGWTKVVTGQKIYCDRREIFGEMAKYL